MSPYRLFLLLCALTVPGLMGCMTTPANGTQLSSTSDSKRFGGFLTGPGAIVELQSATSASGPFTTFASATSGSSPITVTGTDLYSWSTTAVVPTWGTTSCGVDETFVRASLGTSGFSLLTFDNAELGGGQSGMSCVFEELGDGTDVINAAVNCASEDSPVVRLTSGIATYVGDVSVSSQAEADAYACYEVIDGDLTINDDPAELSIAFPALEEITGELDITYSREVAATYTPAIRSVDLSALTTVGGDVALHYPGNGSDLASYDVGLEALNSVAGNVSITAETFNATISGLDVLTAIPGDLTITSTGDDFTIYSLLPVLTDVGGSVHVASGHTTVGVLDSLQSVGGDLSVTDVYWPPGTNFQALTDVGGNLSLADLTLITVGGFANHFPAMTTVGGLFDAEAAGLSDLLVGDSAGLTLGGLRLADMSSLTALSATWITVDPAGSIEIVDNPTITDCDAEAFVTAIGWGGTPTISGNGGC